MADDALRSFARALARKLPMEVETIRAAAHDALDEEIYDVLNPRQRRSPVRHVGPRAPGVASTGGDLLPDDLARDIARRRLGAG